MSANKENLSLSEATQIYWLVKCCWEGRASAKIINVGQALGYLRACRDSESVNPNGNLAKRIDALRDDICMNAADPISLPNAG